MTHPVPLAEIWRGPRPESVHLGHAVICDASGGIVEAWGNPGEVVLPRSSAKMIQALPLVASGAADAAGLGPEHLALACASHSGAAIHTDRVARWIAGMGLGDDDFRCGAHMPWDKAAHDALLCSGTAPCQVHNNCSGKHAGMLALATHHGWETAGYHRPDHPVQRRMRTEVARWSGLEPNDIPVGIDGCGIPCYGLPLDRVARAFRRFGAGESEGATRLLDAIGRAPFMIGGTDRLCSWLPEVTNGRIVAKVGAEGVYGAVVRDLGVGVAVKVEDGSRRAVEPALMAVLESLGALAPAEISELEPHRSPRVTNTRDEVVGEIRFVGAGDPVGAGHPVGAAAASGRGGP